MVEVFEGVRLLELTMPGNPMQCMKGQIVVKSTPFATFLTLMDAHKWPAHKCDFMKVIHTVDDHTDILTGTIIGSTRTCHLGGLISSERKVKKSIHLSRFWRMDEEGIYLIALNTTQLQDSWLSKKVLYYKLYITINIILILMYSCVYCFCVCMSEFV